MDFEEKIKIEEKVKLGWKSCFFNGMSDDEESEPFNDIQQPVVHVVDSQTANNTDMETQFVTCSDDKLVRKLLKV